MPLSTASAEFHLNINITLHRDITSNCPLCISRGVMAKENVHRHQQLEQCWQACRFLHHSSLPPPTLCSSCRGVKSGQLTSAKPPSSSRRILGLNYLLRPYGADESDKLGRHICTTSEFERDYLTRPPTETESKIICSIAETVRRTIHFFTKNPGTWEYTSRP